jgi:lysophospholipase L1-like esterase
MLRRLAYVVVAIAAVAFLVPGSGSANASEDHGRYYLALGDSLAYGYQPTHVTGQGYVDQLYATLHARQPRLTLQNLGCPGETTGTMLNGGVCPYQGFSSQMDAALAFLRQHRERVGLITLDIGANDVNRCAAGGTLDQACLAQGLTTVSTNGAQIVARLRAAAPETTIVAMTYYNPFLAAWLSGPAGKQLAQQSLQVTGVFNTLLSGLFSAGKFRVAQVADAFSTTDMTTQVPLPGVGLVPLDVARICQWTWMCAPAPYGPDIHANQQGYGVIATAFLAALPSDVED